MEDLSGDTLSTYIDQAQNYVNLLKVWTAHTQWLSSKIQPKKYGKSAELIHKGSTESPITISWANS